MIEIQDGYIIHPLPYSDRSIEIQDAFKKMYVGQSIVVSTDEIPGINWDAHMAKIEVAYRRINRNQFRVWRTA